MTTPKAHSIKAFCEAHDISRNLFYTLKKQGLAPKMIALGEVVPEIRTEC